jgi:lipopolysaccharide/colanic/teichoic acid biosynthesis glycosyltransferase
MLIKKWEKLPPELQIEEIRPYWEYLRKKNFSLFWKRVFDIFVSGIVLLIISPFFLILSIAIVIDSRGGVFYRQERVTQYGKHFRIFKFRSMVSGADKKGTLVTVGNDVRITRVGKFIRKCKIDEMSQLIDIFRGTMTFIGTRPEVPKYVEQYKPEYLATLLLPAGVSSTASIMFKNENDMLDKADDADKVYVNQILPIKMKWNLLDAKKYGFWRDIKICFMTVFAVLGKKYKEDAF